MAGRAAPLRSSGAGGRQLVVLILLLLILFLFTAPIVMVFGEDPSVNGKRRLTQMDVYLRTMTTNEQLELKAVSTAGRAQATKIGGMSGRSSSDRG
ncbi:hypothetical protein OsI_37839 [Oryza sativa Indica Group]|uniref:Uncharacterized protein n=1 Tax=Oryza sativa subsp. indica TaxID=39946 RepID=A2ZJ34_ORYSI|nr:hypothetical protein OsI_37839 [Oryza sativa Indica Group]